YDVLFVFFFFQAEDGIRDFHVTGVQTCALPIYFDISKLGKSNSLVENKNLMTENGLRNLYMYSTHKKTHFAVELSKKEVDNLKENYRMFFHVFDKSNNYHNFDIGTIEPILYNGKYFIINHVNFRTKNIKKINFGYFEVSDWKIRYAEQIVELKK